MASRLGYFASTRHPWPCLLFVMPLLVAYEAGVAVLGGADPGALRNGADYWLRLGLAAVGLTFFWLPPAVLTLLFLAWAWWRRDERPGDLVGVLSGMALEGVAYALGLWVLSRALLPLVQQVGAGGAAGAGESSLRQVVTYLGAGIYEEALFRLVLFSALWGVLRRAEVSGLLALPVAAVASAVLFALAHHVGPYGEPYSADRFLFRLAAGVYFALLYQLRGFGIAVGAHACYNVMVSVGAG
jgi:hypothetical protein